MIIILPVPTPPLFFPISWINSTMAAPWTSEFGVTLTGPEILCDN
jgi:hypothetical protein